MELIDIGVNLAHDSFDADRDAVVARAEAAGVAQMVITGATVVGTAKAIELARARPNRHFATAGVHPHHATELDENAFAQLTDLVAAPEVVAVGECGLDYFRDFSPRPAQRAAFTRQLELAARVGKPVFLHQRDAYADFIAIVREFRPQLAGGVAHCFTGHAQELADCLALDLAIGITGWICDERRGNHLVPLMPQVPAARLLLETDAPYLLPRDLQPAPKSRRNEPYFLTHVAEVVARARGETLVSLATSSTLAARALFKLPTAA
jgi:TatD DNase family protein